MQMLLKSLHKSLRSKVKQGNDPDIIWKSLIEDKETLKIYAKSMSQLAKNNWQKNCSENRIYWCKNVCWSYFIDGGLQKLVRKQEKTQLYERLKTCGIEENDEERKNIDEMMSAFVVCWSSMLKDKLLLLDVGSCFNPFKEFEEFCSIPIDISPAIDEVLYCDFLNVSFKPNTHSENKRTDISHFIHCIERDIKGNQLTAGIFDIVVFSLLLSYFPSPMQRLECCINAHKALQLYGLLVIVTPDSSHQNRHTEMMKSWKNALEQIGFKRFKYEKLEHLRCMAYQKSAAEHELDIKEKLSKHFYIPQDFQELEETESSEK